MTISSEHSQHIFCKSLLFSAAILLSHASYAEQNQQMDLRLTQIETDTNKPTYKERV